MKRFLLIVWLAATAINITKPVHIDDSEYLQIAGYIAQNPSHPMTGKIVVYPGLETSIYNSNHPLFVPYIYALTIKIFGESEIVFHLAISFFTLIAVLSSYLIAREIIPKFARLIPILFILSPAFIPSQNLMADVPLISLWLLFFFLFIKKLPSYFWAAVVLGVSLLIKYASLILMPILLVNIILTKKLKYIFVLLIPILVLIAWSAFNYFDYGGIHILGATKAPFFVSDLGKKLLLWLITLGSVTPFSLLFLPIMLAKKKRLIILLGGEAVIAAFTRIFWQFPNEPVINSFLRTIFLGNGIFVASLTLYCAIKQLMKINWHKITHSNHIDIILFLWFLLPSLFIIQFVPFLAVRHVLLVMPAIILILAKNLFSQVSSRWIYAGLSATVILGIILGIADYQQANTYRIFAPEIYKQIKQDQEETGKNSTVWFAGFWDWQYYAQKAGMKQYDSASSKLNEGDYLVMPNLMQQSINPLHLPQLKKIYRIIVETTPSAVFKTLTNNLGSPAGYYAMLDPRHLPWTISVTPLETFLIFQVVSREVI